MNVPDPENAPTPVDAHVRLATWDDDPPAGGQGVYMRGLRRSLAQAGVRTSTVAGRGASAIVYRRLSGHGPLDLSIQLNLDAGPLLQGSPDLIHVSGGPGGLQLLRRLGPPIVYTAHHTFEMSHPRYKPQRWYGLVESRSYKLAKAVIAVSASTADSLRRMGVEDRRIAVIPPGIDLHRFVLPPARGEKRLLFVGRLEREKGPLDAISAMERVIAEVPGCTGLVIGTGHLRSAVVGRVTRTRGISYRTSIPDDELAHCYASSDVVMMPSAFEGLGFVALEAMASGCAVVGYDVPGLRDAISGRGILVPPGDIGALAAACRSLLTEPARLEDMAAGASGAVRTEHCWNRRIEEVIEVYHGVLSGDR